MVIYASRCTQVCPRMRQTSEIRFHDPSAYPKVESIIQSLALCSVGFGHSRSPPWPLIVTTDYFNKWIEAKPLSNIRDVDAKRFLWKSFITQFGVPWAIISNNGTQFEGRVFIGFCSGLSIMKFFSSPANPQFNGQAKVSNKVILDGVKNRLEGDGLRSSQA